MHLYLTQGMINRMHDLHGSMFTLGRVSKSEGWKVYHKHSDDYKEYHKIEFDDESARTMFLLRYGNKE